MAYTMPVNLMTTAAPATAAQSNLSGIANINAQTAVQPAPASTGSQSAASDHNTGGQASNQQQALIYKRATLTSAQLNKAEPQSVVTAQSATAAQQTALKQEPNAALEKAMVDSLAATQPETAGQSERVEKLDRYAPPDPLPTAPVLKDKPFTPVTPVES